MLDETQTTEYRSLTCTLLYASQDIIEVQHAVRTLTSDLKRPTEMSWKRLKRLVRYMIGVQNEAIFFPHGGGENTKQLVASTDTDWAGCKKTRKSVGMTILKVGGCLLYSQCTGQSIHAQSSGESEFYGIVSGVSAACGLQHALEFVGEPVSLVVESDSSAARAVLWRSGVGKIRHLEVKTLWAQAMVRDGRLQVRAVKGEHNMADIGTKILGKARIDYLKELIWDRDDSEEHEQDGENLRSSVAAIDGTWPCGPQHAGAGDVLVRRLRVDCEAHYSRRGGCHTDCVHDVHIDRHDLLPPRREAWFSFRNDYNKFSNRG